MPWSTAGTRRSQAKQCALLDVSRSDLYYRPKGIPEEDFTLMKLIDRQYLVTPFYEARKMAAWLKGQGYSVNRKRYFETKKTKSIVAVRPKPPFRPIFQVAASKANAEIRIINEPLDVLPKGSPVFLVETGESRTPRPEKTAQDMLQA